MSKIKFTHGTIERIDSEFFTLVLFNGNSTAYKATIEEKQATILINKYDNQKIKLICNK